METTGRIAVIGAGFMGAVIACIYGRHGYHVALHDKEPSMLKSFQQRTLPIAETICSAEHPIDAILDKQLQELLSWLQLHDPVSKVGVKKSASAEL